MTLGDGIFYSTLLLVLAAAIHQISVRHKWKLAAKAAGTVAVLVALTGGGIYAWVVYQDRPRPATEFFGIRPGMTPIEVTLALGKPTRPSAEQEQAERRPMWFYTETETTPFEGMKIVRFDGEGDSRRVTSICLLGGAEGLLGIYPDDTEREVVRRLGEPVSESIEQDGLMKYISYPHLHVTYTIQAGKVGQRCLALHAMQMRDEASGALPAWMLAPLVETEERPRDLLAPRN